MKGIILAGGSGTRLYPATLAISKQLIPIHDKPMVYYPLSTLMMAGIRDILLISTPADLPQFQKLLKDGSQFGIRMSYLEQPKPEGIAQTFILGRNFVGNDPVCLVLGDNIFYGHDLMMKLQHAARHTVESNRSVVFGYHVINPGRYGVVTFDENRRALDIEEKPEKPRSRWAVTGLYFYPPEVVEIAAGLKPSKRGELEITDVNKVFLERERLDVELLGRGYAWLDTGTHESLTAATLFIRTIEERQGLKIGCPEEVAYLRGFISATQLQKQSQQFHNSNYGQYLLELSAQSSSLED